MTCPDCGRKKWILMQTPLAGRCPASRGWSVDIADCLRFALASERNARLKAGEEVDREKARRWEMEKERGEMNAALKGEMARAEKAEKEVGRLRDALREILVGMVRADYEHPMGEWASMAARFLNIARAALEPKP